MKIILNEKIKHKAFEDLKIQKEKHSKVKEIQYASFEMQKYLKSCETKITQEEAQEIFKLRTRTSDVKINFKGKYETFECDACNIQEETQKHVIQECKILNEEREKNFPEYEEIFTGNVRLKRQIAKRFLKNKILRQKLENRKE